MLLGGAQAEALAQRLRGYGMDAKCVSEKLGVASAIKMCSSVMIKGQEALAIESYATAGAYGVEDHVLPTLIETFPSIDREKQGAYFFSRVLQHGKRRAEEMRCGQHGAGSRFRALRGSFVPISYIGNVSMVMLAVPGFPAQSMADLPAAAPPKHGT